MAFARTAAAAIEVANAGDACIMQRFARTGIAADRICTRKDVIELLPSSTFTTRRIQRCHRVFVENAGIDNFLDSFLHFRRLLAQLLIPIEVFVLFGGKLDFISGTAFLSIKRQPLSSITRNYFHCAQVSV
jgi:hypothetical protein